MLISRRAGSEDLGSESSAAHAGLRSLDVHSSGLFNPSGRRYFASLSCTLAGVRNNFSLSVCVTNKAVSS